MIVAILGSVAIVVTATLIGWLAFLYVVHNTDDL